jgi:hypothetical protein
MHALGPRQARGARQVRGERRAQGERQAQGEGQARPQRLAWLAGFTLAGVVLFAAYLLQSTRDTFVNSDGASNALQAWAMLHGNLLLRGWAVSDVSFYTTELPQYMLVEAIRGLGADVVHICGAMSYTLLVLLAAAVAKGRAAGREGVARALMAAGIMLAPQLGWPTNLLTLSPDHVGTGVPLLLTWLLIDRGAGFAQRQRGWRRCLVPVLAGLLLAWTAVGDPLAEVIGALPLALVCALRASQGLLRERHQEPGQETQQEPGQGLLRGLRTQWYELSLLMAAVLSVFAARLATTAITAAGGWTVSPVRTSLAEPGTLGQHAYLTGMGILDLFGADFLDQPNLTETIFAVLHLVGLALVALAFCLAVRRFLGGDLLVQVLTAAIVVNVAAYAFSTQAQDIKNTREIAALLPFGAALAGRLLAGRLLAAREARQAREPGPRRVPRLVTWLAGAMLACYAVMLGVNAVQPQVPTQPATLAVWLAAHNLTSGLGGYWQANSVTLDSGDGVQVRALEVDAGKLATGTNWEADHAWYDPATAYANFVVDIPTRCGPADPGELVTRMTFRAGKPSRLYCVGPYAIAVWNRNLLTRFSEQLR